MQILKNRFGGNAERFVRWAENGWQEREAIPLRQVITLPFAPGKEYSVTVVPCNTYLDTSPRIEYPCFEINVRSSVERTRQQDKRFTVAKVLPNFELAELQMMGWVGGGVWIRQVTEVLAISPLGIYFQDGQITRVYTAPNLQKGLKQELLARVDEGPTSDLWFI